MFQMTDEQQTRVQALAEQFQLDLLILFGSQVTGQTHAESDYDVGYMSRRSLDFTEEGRLILALMPIVEVHDERIINLVSLRRVKPLLLYGATKSAHVLFEATPTTFARLRAYAYRQYVEMQPLYRLKAERMGIKL